MSNQVVIFEELEAGGGSRIGVVRLNAPRSMNALSLEMIHSLKARLDQWAADDGIGAVWLEGEGEKAFCAGGDIVALYRDMTEPRSDSQSVSEGEAFFTDEYELDYLIHTYPKPFIIWGNGLVIGGGLGLMVGGSHRIVTEHSRVAMPEVSIGLYPDVGAGWFLNRMPGRTGLFLGLTGAHMNAADAIFTGLADRFIRHDMREEVKHALQHSDFDTGAHAAVNKVLRRFEAGSRDALPRAVVREHFDVIQSLTDGDSLLDVVDNLGKYAGDDPWLIKAVKTVASASPASLTLTWQHYHNTLHDSLSQVFDKELQLSLRSLKMGEFAEGVRALLIDKDLKPRWYFPTLESVDPEWIDRFFMQP
ncbi:enoyl-CoA hydratase/isomerase family protein [Marinobacter orientalis]|uniref:3-hydroxyisobutyryl-CoA hydrolase n=1 Tax=Marinobacter orientalis TaxID=1928859 RepID=A0A7Y0NKY6_9GAMM|nr:enoyl-CoA hydratase/isomerase family protein [Marinobacter orientalis]NMT63078.1 enoyl-CoA hydratase/isomerase family protein [Marinobacter orientalis]TGX51738.1 enoyl-CoA hydratase/isomerase family protein [Marinobacter orientalis]